MSKISVLMPVYNAEKYLAEAVESILRQTFTDFEFLIIDDGSTDSSLNIINSYQDNRIRLVRNNHNMGISNTLNKGIEMAKSDIIARMDADDISLPDRLLIQFNFLKENPECVLAGTGAETISKHGMILEKFKPNGDFLYFNLIFCCWGIYHPSVMYRRQAVLDVGSYPLTLSEDFKLWCKLIRKYRLDIIPDMLIKYRISPQSISNFVLKKEYMDDEKKQIISNFHFYCGENYTIPDSWLECYRGNYSPLCEQGKVSDIVSCIDELDVIASHLLKKNNINHNAKSIVEAANEKKEYVKKNFLNRLKPHQKMLLMARLKMYSKLTTYIRNGFSTKFLKK